MPRKESFDSAHGPELAEGLTGRVREPARERRVLYDVDVAVAGSGLCSTFAAISAGRCGARTVLIERFGHVGGNMGPAMIVNGSIDGEADAKYLREPYNRKTWPTYYNDTQFLSLVAGVDLKRFEVFCKQETPLSGEDKLRGEPPGQLAGHPRPLISALRKARLKELGLRS